MTITATLITAAATIVAAVLTALGVKAGRKQEGLDKAASWWEKAVHRLEQEAKEHDSRIRTLEDSNSRLERENRAFRTAIREVVAWITANLEHEKQGKGPPLPYPFDRLLDRLLAAISGDD